MRAVAIMARRCVKTLSLYKSAKLIILYRGGDLSSTIFSVATDCGSILFPSALYATEARLPSARFA